MLPDTQNENYKYKDQVQKFVQLVFEDSKDHSLLSEIVSTVGINTVFPCYVLWKNDEMEQEDRIMAKRPSFSLRYSIKMKK